MRIQPIDVVFVKHPQQSVTKSRLWRLFDRPFKRENDVGFVAPSIEPSSLCLDKMVRNFIEDGNTTTDKAVKCGRNVCNCFNGNFDGSSDDEDEIDFFFDTAKTDSPSFSDFSDALKSLVSCASVRERNLLADTSTIMERSSKTCKRRDDLRRIVAENLIALGHDASVCVSKWEKSSSIPAGEHEYIDLIINGDRLIIDVDFRSEFDIARSTSSYKQILQYLPSIFVGKSDRLLQIVAIASEAARQSLKKKGMHIAPWRRAEYMKSKWLSPCSRKQTKSLLPETENDDVQKSKGVGCERSDDDGKVDVYGREEKVVKSETGELDLIFGEVETKTTTS